MFNIDPNLSNEEKAVLEAQLAETKELAELYYNTHGMPLCYSALPQVNGEAEVAVQPELDMNEGQLEVEHMQSIVEGVV